LQADLDPDDPRQADVAEIQKAGASGAALTRQLLAFSRNQIIQPTLLDLNVVVADMKGLLERLLIREDIAVAMNLQADPATLRADRGQLEQVILNLAVNARDAMPLGGRLTIETATVNLDDAGTGRHRGIRPGSYVVLTITDTGSGMTAEVQARLFEPFFTTKEPGRGTGLGLATVQGIVARSGGSVHVESEVGRGTSFHLYFPGCEAAETPADGPPQAARSQPGLQTVLVVEDAAGLRALTKRLLERSGYSVLTAADGDEALRLFDAAERIDVVLTDVMMPGTTGPELIAQLTARRPGVKVIYMSGYTEDMVTLAPGLTQDTVFLHKPFTSTALIEKIRELLEA
jgi:CheY-like chemotaxis protein